MNTTDTQKPERANMDLRNIASDPYRFQYRHAGTDPLHVRELARALANTGRPFDPLWIWIDAETGSSVVISGHHRLEAYRQAKWKRKVPVRVYRCDVHLAQLLAAEGNRKQNLPMSRAERNDTAWRLTCIGGFSKRQITNATTVSDGTVAKMRRTKKLLKDAEHDLPESWWMSMQLAKGVERPELTEDEKAEMLSAKTDELDEQFGTLLGVAMHRHPEATMAVIAKRLGEQGMRRLADEYELGEYPYALGDEDDDLEGIDENVPEATGDF